MWRRETGWGKTRCEKETEQVGRDVWQKMRKEARLIEV